MPADGAASSGYLVETGQSRILLDCGPGIAVMLGEYLHASLLDAVVISHGWNDNLVALAADVDIFLAESTLAEPDHTAHGHLCATEVGRAAAAAGARSVVLTHLGSAQHEWQQARCDDVSAEFDGPVHLSRPGMRFSVPAEQPR